jgi:hypothetical protein
MAQYALGRVFNVAPAIANGATGTGISLRDCSGVSFVCTGNDTFTLVAATSFAGSYAQPSGWNPLTVWYTNSSLTGAGQWVKVTHAATNAVTIASGTVVFDLLSTQVPDTYDYVAVTVGASGLVAAVLHDLEYQRTPPNLPKISA